LVHDQVKNNGLGKERFPKRKKLHGDLHNSQVRIKKDEMKVWARKNYLSKKMGQVEKTKLEQKKGNGV